MIQKIPETEFDERIRKIQAEMVKNDLDAFLAFTTEAEPANVRYLADYWPSFESAAVLIPKEGKPLLIIGPESGTCAKYFSKIPDIRQILEFRESSDPEYPGAKLSNFDSVFDEISKGKGIKNLGIAGLNYMTVPIYLKIKEVMEDRPIIRADKIMAKVRFIKSENELMLMQQAYDLSVRGCGKVLSEIKPGMTEIQLTEIARHEMLMNGAETDGYVIWVASGETTANAISRPTHRKVKKGDLLNLNIGAKVEGYSCSVCRPFSLGMPDKATLDLMKVGLDTANYSREIIKPGVLMSEAAKKVRAFLRKAGYEDHILYGPAHGNGIMECEYPFVEESIDEMFVPGMTLSIDTFLAKYPRGIRFEDGVVFTDTDIKPFTNWKREIIIVDC